MADNSAPEGLDELVAEANKPVSQENANIPAKNDTAPVGLNDFIQPELNDAKYGSLGQQALAGLEGAAQGIAGPLAPLAEQALGVAPEDILARQEANPVTHYGSEIAGLAGSAISGVGLGSLLGKAGAATQAGTEALGIGKLGSSVAKHAIENLVFQSSEEAAKLALGDPNQSVETAVTDMGLAALVGGAFGTISPIWKAASSTKTGQLLKAVADKMGGIEDVSSEPVNDMISKAGIDIAPEIKAGLSNYPEIQEIFKNLEQSDTTASGKGLQASYGDFRRQMGDEIVKALGKSPEEVGGELSKAEAGKSIGSALASEYKSQLAPIAEQFESLKEKFKDTPLNASLSDRTDILSEQQENEFSKLKSLSNKVLKYQKNGNVSAAVEVAAKIEQVQQNIRLLELQKKAPGTTDSIINKISKKAIDEGWVTSPSSDIMREVNRAIKELPLQKTLKNLNDYVTQLNNNTQKDLLNGPLRRAGGIMNGIIRSASDDIIENRLGAEAGPQAVAAYKAARASYATQAALKDAIDSRLHIRGSTSGYGDALQEMANTDGEKVLQRLSGVNDADLLGFLQQNYPQTASLIKDYHINNLLKAASDKAAPGMNINSEVLLKNLNKLSPELKSFIAPTESMNKVSAIGDLMQKFHELPHNFSNTARTYEKLTQHIPGTVVGLATAMSSHSPIAGIVTGTLTKLIGKDIPDAARLAFLRFMGSSQRIDSEGFKSMVELINHTVRGENLTSRAIKNVFRAGSEVLPQSAVPGDKDRSNLEKALKNLKEEPDKMFNVAGKAGYYMPEHGSSLGETAARAVQFLNDAKPDTDKQSPLDTQRNPSSAETSAYNRKLDISQQPLIVLNHIKNGTLTPQDVITQKTLYPNLYNRLSQKLTEEMINNVNKKIPISYSTKMGLSLYLGQALDSTMLPQNIQAAQPQAQQAQPQTATQPASNPKRSTTGLNKLPNMFKTKSQSAEEDRIRR